ncbi:hypothetical protein PDG61_20925 [Mycolicibacterium sp. BiH015]|uniref:hypothetical protein n=1 Tax=Mycolicibacterium sp. BiH015 TaxID=3018808 RepID=UPI0022E40D77|nr:hypothetical protein [Mycolicibacterium sp. BiH015]MDA2893391.1 hypothetical protein [Mycolicibacterium sp. BiH015]
MAVNEDRFDDLRRAWIAAHQGWSTIQRRRAELLGRRIRARQRAIASAVADPHDDTSLPPIWLRTSKSPATHIELLMILGLGMSVPIGWLLGWVFYTALARLVPGTLRGFPITALLWASVVLAVPVLVLYDPAPGFGNAVVVPWMCAQLVAIPAAAGVLGIANGWLALEASKAWWPLTPPKPSLSAAEAAEILGGYDTTGLGVLDAVPLNTPGTRTHL